MNFKSKGKDNFTCSEGKGNGKGVHVVSGNGRKSSSDRGWKSSGWTTQEWSQPVEAPQPPVSSDASRSAGPSTTTYSPHAMPLQGVPLETNACHVLSVSPKLFSVGTNTCNKYSDLCNLSLMFDTGAAIHVCPWWFG